MHLQQQRLRNVREDVGNRYKQIPVRVKSTADIGVDVVLRPKLTCCITPQNHQVLLIVTTINRQMRATCCLLLTVAWALPKAAVWLRQLWHADLQQNLQ